MPAIEYNPMFLAAMVATLLDVTSPDSSIANPAAIHITKNPDTRNRNVFKMYCTSPSTSALAYELKRRKILTMLIKYKDFLINDNFIYCEGEPSKQSDDNAFKVITKKIFSIEYIQDKLVNEVSVKIDYEIKNDSIINDLYSLCEKYKGEYPLTIHLTNSLGKSQKVKSNTIFISIKNDCIQALKSLVGQNNVWFN